MNSRYNKTERKGVIETQRIIVNQLGWVFREQPPPDFGIDAIMEQTNENGNPNGKLMGLQIKSRKWDFKVISKKLTFLISNIHYNYWTNHDIPIIFIVHFPDTQKTYWQHINEETIQRTKNQWKIEIPIKQIFSEKSKVKLNHILTNYSLQKSSFDLYLGNSKNETIYDLIENVNFISESTKNIITIINLINETTSISNNFTSQINEFINRKLNLKSPEVVARIKKFSASMNILSKRLLNEIELFTEIFSRGCYSYEKVLFMFYKVTNNTKIIESVLETIETTPISFQEGINGIMIMRNSANSLPSNIPFLKDSKQKLVEVLDIMINEFKTAQNMSLSMVNNIKFQINGSSDIINQPNNFENEILKI